MASQQDSYSCQVLWMKKGKLSDSQAIERSINDLDGDMTLRMKKKLLVRGGMTSGGHPGLDTRIIPPLPA